MSRKCLHGGGAGCKRQGGDGSLRHVQGYIHPMPTALELGGPVADYEDPEDQDCKKAFLPGLDAMFDEDLAKSILSTSVFEMIDVPNLVKSLYGFDVKTEEGILKILDALPILDPAILRELVKEIWIGYEPEEDEDPELMRSEIRGYLQDYLS